MEIIDAQIHPVAPMGPWSESFPAEHSIEASAGMAVAAMDAVGVNAAIVNWTLPEVRGYLTHRPGRFAGLPFGGPALPIESTPDDYVGEIAETPGMVGVRLALDHPQDPTRIERFRAGEFDPWFDAAERHRLPVFVLAHGHLPELHDTIRAHDELTFVIDHLGLHTPPARALTPDRFDDLPNVLALAQFPNVAMKLTGAPSLSVEQYPFTDMWPYVHQYLEAFGADRLMWGSDFTRCAPLHTYRESVDFLLHTAEVDAATKEALFSGTIRRWLDWPDAVGSVQP